METKKPTDLYYIQDSRSYVGNCVVFWGKNNSGYVCDITKAGLYTYEEAMSQHKSRHTDIPWLKEDVENALRTFCDSQYLSKRQHEVCDELEQHKLNKAKKDKDDRARAHIAKLSDDLTYTMECLWSNVSFPLEREEVIESISKYVIKSKYYDQYHTPVIYNMTSTDIFKALMKSKKLKKCKRCELFTDDLEDNMCQACINELEEEKIMTTNKDLIIDELKDEVENLAYENKRMADFIETLGVKLDDLVDYVINGNNEEVKMMIDYIIKNNR